MVLTSTFYAFGVVVSLAGSSVADLILGPRAAFEAFGLIGEFGGEGKAVDEYMAQFAPAPLLGEKNSTTPMLKDRSLELVRDGSLELEKRQSCPAGDCYGYCITPGDTCCPDGPCKPDWGCCGPNCYPKGGNCCLDYNYCEPGNVCVLIKSSGRIVCCTDLSCTAAVQSGTTTYFTVPATSATAASRAITSAPSIVTAAATSIGSFEETWYWTVTWWYRSFWWTTIGATSRVTYTTIYSTTTFTTTATDEAQARSEFSALSATLSFPIPASAQTSLLYYLTAQPSGAASTQLPQNTGFTFNPGAFSSTASANSATVRASSKSESATSSTVTTTKSTVTTTKSTLSAASGSPAATTSQSKASMEMRDGWMVLLGVLMAMPGILMVWL
ncbi:hypothetical protein K432DRAFT_307015 [Lepidopterella palustris CBS 459.81]|uniref:GPI anchored protein n=1 Tax=Lepidopterella palustris CBS 459.81 TaxID=1314670 RepID=A0A8E2JBC3_9PEZI|nr:hypothetical protein K432DRAFT_307015 [Lepidopterella palustris CBS 459.81]